MLLVETGNPQRNKPLPAMRAVSPEVFSLSQCKRPLRLNRIRHVQLLAKFQLQLLSRRQAEMKGAPLVFCGRAEVIVANAPARYMHAAPRDESGKLVDCLSSSTADSGKRYDLLAPSLDFTL
jgi:hypothetical protein